MMLQQHDASVGKSTLTTFLKLAEFIPNLPQGQVGHSLGLNFHYPAIGLVGYGDRSGAETLKSLLPRVRIKSLRPKVSGENEAGSRRGQNENGHSLNRT